MGITGNTYHAAICTLDILFQKYFLHFLYHLLASGDPDGGGDCHGHQPGQARSYDVEHLKECREEADEEHDHVEEDECHESLCHHC